MISPIASTGAFDVAANRLRSSTQTPQPNKKALAEKQAFQDFAAGTFYQTMLKALRSTEKETKYFNGGRAEKIFRSEFDQRVASSLAKEHGEQFAGPLFDQHSTLQNRASSLIAAVQDGLR